MSLSSPTTVKATMEAAKTRATVSKGPIAATLPAPRRSSFSGLTVPSLRTHRSHQEATVTLGAQPRSVYGMVQTSATSVRLPMSSPPTRPSPQ